MLGKRPWRVPSPQELSEFKKRKNTGPTNKDFRLDLASEGVASDWNKHAAKVFSFKFIDDFSLDNANPDHIRHIFMMHLETLQKHYRSDTICLTTAEEIRKRDQQKAAAQDQRRRTVKYFSPC